ncbi:hypothetical protein [Streptomyces kanamyceticus]|uniref:hypothetical protein n=1 Tax=Streptomyces kanamyceticus TaxID=1967 RepID=UPI000B2070FB|nr:hypothetical protein [Streptomyces kanamyceticus]
MGLRRKHRTKVYDVGFGNYNFRCSCGAMGRPTCSRREMATKARLHVEQAARR